MNKTTLKHIISEAVEEAFDFMPQIGRSRYKDCPRGRKKKVQPTKVEKEEIDPEVKEMVNEVKKHFGFSGKPKVRLSFGGRMIIITYDCVLDLPKMKIQYDTDSIVRKYGRGCSRVDIIDNTTLIELKER